MAKNRRKDVQDTGYSNILQWHFFKIIFRACDFCSAKKWINIYSSGELPSILMVIYGELSTTIAWLNPMNVPVVWESVIFRITQKTSNLIHHTFHVRYWHHFYANIYAKSYAYKYKYSAIKHYINHFVKLKKNEIFKYYLFGTGPSGQRLCRFKENVPQMLAVFG